MVLNLVKIFSYSSGSHLQQAVSYGLWHLGTAGGGQTHQAGHVIREVVVMLDQFAHLTQFQQDGQLLRAHIQGGPQSHDGHSVLLGSHKVTRFHGLGLEHHVQITDEICGSVKKVNRLTSSHSFCFFPPFNNTHIMYI